MRRDDVLTLERLHALLDAYGGTPGRWPADERAAAERLILTSAAARGAYEEARALDRLLAEDEPVAPPSPALAARVLSGAPAPRPQRRWRRALVAVVPLATAAAVALWVTTARGPGERIGAPSPVAVGDWESPTDVLLDPLGVDVSANVPSVGCADSMLGCPAVDDAAQPYSLQRATGRILA